MASSGRCTISTKQREALIKRFKEDGMNGCSNGTLAVRQAAAGETGLSIETINHWINNYKKRGGAPSKSASCPSISKVTGTAKLLNNKKLRKVSAYNAFSKDFHHQEDLKGKSLGEKSKLMAKTWRTMSEADREKYEEGLSDDEQELSTKEKKWRIHKMARRLQRDATQLESVGCEIATLMFVDGQTVTVGSKKGKEFLQSHPAIPTAFTAHFLYDDLAAKYKQPVLPAVTDCQLQSTPVLCSVTETAPIT